MQCVGCGIRCTGCLAVHAFVLRLMLPAFPLLLLLLLQSLQLSGLSVLSSLSAGAAEGEVAGEVLVPTQLLDRLLALIRQHDTHEQVRALVCSNASADAAYVKLMAGLNRHLFCVVICLLLSACYPTCCWESFLLLGAWQVKGYSE